MANIGYIAPAQWVVNPFWMKNSSNKRLWACVMRSHGTILMKTQLLEGYV